MTTQQSSRTGTARHPIQIVSAVVGVVFLLVGILGFVPGATANTDQLMIAGHHSGALLLELFNVSILHNLVHLAFGVAGLAWASGARRSRGFLIYGGAIYLVLWIYGLFVDFTSPANFVPVNTADNWLQLGLAIGMPAVGVVLARSVSSAGTRPAAQAR